MRTGRGFSPGKVVICLRYLTLGKVKSDGDFKDSEAAECALDAGSRRGKSSFVFARRVRARCPCEPTVRSFLTVTCVMPAFARVQFWILESTRFRRLASYLKIVQVWTIPCHFRTVGKVAARLKQALGPVFSTPHSSAKMAFAV